MNNSKSDLPERTFDFAKRIINVVASLDERKSVQKVSAYQLIRSGTSIGANTEEAQSSQSEADFLTKYSIACKEARETSYWLRLLKETGIIPDSKLNDIINECNEIIAILTSIIKELKAKRNAK